MKNRSVSVIVPALNEQERLEATVRSIQNTVKDYFRDWEIIIFNDGSTDNTGAIADGLARFDPRVKVVHHQTPWNLGACYKEGVHKASKEYVILIPGDGEIGANVMEIVFNLTEVADMIIPYTCNLEVRSLKRRLLSRGFVHAINAASGCRVKYYNGPVLHRSALVRSCEMSNGFGYQAEILVQLIRRGASYHEVAMEITKRPERESKALRLANILDIIGVIVKIFVKNRLSNPKTLKPIPMLEPAEAVVESNPNPPWRVNSL